MRSQERTMSFNQAGVNMWRLTLMLLPAIALPGMLDAQRTQRTSTRPASTADARLSVDGQTEGVALRVQMQPGTLTRRPTRTALKKMVTILYPLGPFEAELGVTAHLTASAPVSGGKTGVTTTSAWQHLRLFDQDYFKQDDHWLLDWPKQVYSGGTVSVHFSEGSLKTPTLVNCLVAPDKNEWMKVSVKSMGDYTPLVKSEVTFDSPQQLAVLIMPTEGWHRVTLENLKVGSMVRVYYCDVTPVK